MYPHDKLDWNLSRLEKRLNDAPDDAPARQEYAVAALSKALFHEGGEVWFNTALTQARRLLQHDPANPAGLVVAGHALVGLDRLEPSARYLDEALKLGPERADVHLALGAMYRAQSDRHQAVRELEIACRCAPDAWEPNYLLGRLLAERADELGASRRLLERSQYHTVRALQLGPSPALEGDLLHLLGASCLRAGRHEEALKIFTRLQEHEKFRSKTQYYLGLVSYHLGKYKNSVLHLRRHLEKYPDDPHVHARIGMAYLQLNEVAKAREACHRALAIEPHDLQARWTLGCALLEEGHADEAIRTFREILEDAPDHLPAFAEMVRVRKGMGDAEWLRKALRAEVSVFDRLPSRDHREHPSGRGMVEIDPRASTSKRIGVLLRTLGEMEDDSVSDLLTTLDLTTDESVRFQVWEAALAQLAAGRARKLVKRLRAPGVHFSAKAGREILTISEFLPEALITKGLLVEEEHLKRAAVDRHGPANDVAGHRANIDRERQEARAWQALLLLAVATRKTRGNRNLLVRWASDADPELADAARAALVMLGDLDAAAPLRERTAKWGADELVDTLIAHVTPPAARIGPRTVSDDQSLHCATCGRRSVEAGHMMQGDDAVVCDRCMMDILRDRRSLRTDDPAIRCSLCERTNLDSRAVYVQRGVPVCADCVDHSIGLAEREEVDRHLATL